MNMIKRILITVLSLALVAGSALAKAEEVTIGLHTVSYHFSKAKAKVWGESDYNYNNVNPGIYGVYQGWTAGVFYNSERRTSVYLGYTKESPQWHKMTAAVTVGLITGYGKGARPFPMLIPSVAWEHGFLGQGSQLRLMFMPKAAENGSAALHLSQEWKF